MTVPEDFDTLIGTGTGLINPNSQDFLELRKAIEAHASKFSTVEKARIKIKGLGYKLYAMVYDDTVELLPPGELLKAFIDASGVTQREFAEFIGMKSPNLSAIINGSRRISMELAITLGRIFEVEAGLWLNLQTKVELAQLPSARGPGQPGLDELLKRKA